MSQFARILVIQTSFIGDVILATSVLESLHAEHPEAKIDLVVKKGNESLFIEHPFIGKLWVWDKSSRKYQGLLQLGIGLRKEGYDLVINLHRFTSSGLLSLFTAAEHRAGFKKNPLHTFYHHAAEHRMDGEHEIERNFKVIASYVQLTKPLPPKLYPSASDDAAIKDIQSTSYYCMAPSSVWFTKQWPADKWVELILALPQESTIFLLGAPTDHAHNERILNDCAESRVINLAGKLSLLQSAALMKGAVMNFVNDSAPLHLASAVNAPVTAIFCSTVPKFGFRPLSDEQRIVESRGKLECRPCGLHGHPQCPKGHFQCARSISAAEVLHG